MATNGNVNHHDQYAAPAQTTEAPASADNSNLPKDEVGWYFVEQYYTTLSKAPERLHLFYGKKSQFVSGLEAAVVPVSVGRQAIQERIKSMDFQECKVRISNVDSQGSGENIIIQVIGEISNKGGEPKKFVQTFVLAQQPSGYFVLNDMLRYIDEDLEEEGEAAAEESAAPAEATPAVEAEAEPEAPAAEEAAPEAEPAQADTAAVSEKLEEAAAEAPATEEAPAVEPAVEAQEPVTTEEAEAPTDVEKTVEEIAKEEVEQPEEPKDPAPTPATAPVPARAAAPAPAPAPAQPEKPREPPKPMSWASRVAAAAGAPRPVVPIPKTATPPAPAQARAPAPAAAQQAAPAAPQAESAAGPAGAPKDQGNEWQTAETKRQSRAQPAVAAPPEKEGTMAYIKYVTDKVKDEDLKGLLSTFGELAYFDINRQKNCAFVEFKTQAGYAAAVNANPHTVNGENIVVEQRRPKANAYGGVNYNATRGGAGGRGSRGGYEPTRSGSQSGRGGFTGQTRGRGGGPRGGRGASQAGTTA